MSPLPLASAPFLTRDELRHVVAAQAGVVGREQLSRAGLSDEFGRGKVRSGGWRRLYPGVYLTNTGIVTFAARCWAAVLVCGPGAVIAGTAAAYLNRTVTTMPTLIDVLVPESRKVVTRPGLRVARRRGLPEDGQLPPRTGVAATALDLVAVAATDDAVVGHVADAARQMRTLEPLRRARAARRRLPHSRLVDDLLAPASEGLESPLEWRFDRRVVRAHGLPPFRRQVQEVVGGVLIRADAVSDFGTRAELDGRLHVLQLDADVWRDNAVAISSDETTLRYRWRHVAGTPCAVAGQVAGGVTRGGWAGRIHPCGPQ